ncbi:homeodomain-only protein-like [Tachypleus tridentatus]|uniref:homeodomain-only protein-like n=1 Tax=Tachypleus tridentatus TaxID=6853 RepID=UPI003FD5E799
MSVSVIHAQLAPYYKLPRVQIHQEEYLESIFQKNKNPNYSDLVIWSAEVGLTVEEIKIWFENRLACWRQEQGLPANGKLVNE